MVDLKCFVVLKGFCCFCRFVFFVLFLKKYGVLEVELDEV